MVSLLEELSDSDLEPHGSLAKVDKVEVATYNCAHVNSGSGKRWKCTDIKSPLTWNIVKKQNKMQKRSEKKKVTTSMFKPKYVLQNSVST